MEALLEYGGYTVNCQLQNSCLDKTAIHIVQDNTTVYEWILFEYNIRLWSLSWLRNISDNPHLEKFVTEAASQVEAIQACPPV